MVDEFWANHLTMAEAGRKLGFSRQAIFKRSKFLKGIHPDTGIRGIPVEYVTKTLALRERDAEVV